MIISNCFVGNSITVDPTSFQNFLTFKNFIIEKLEIYDSKKGNSIVILNDAGMKLKENNFRNFEISYVFDKDLLNADDETIDGNYIPMEDDDESSNSLIRPIESPINSIDNINDYTSRQLISLLTTNLSWLDALLNDSKIIESLIQINVSDIHNKIESINIVDKYLKRYLNDLNKKFTVSRKILVSLNEDGNIDNIEQINYHKLENIHLINNAEDEKKTLANLVDFNEISSKIKDSKKLISQLNSENAKIENRSAKLYEELNNLSVNFDSFKAETDIIDFITNVKNKSKSLIANIERIFQIFQNETKKFINRIPLNYYNDLTLKLNNEEKSLLEITLMKFKKTLIPEFELYFKELYNFQKLSKTFLLKINLFLNANHLNNEGYLRQTKDFLEDLNDFKNDLRSTFFQRINDLQIIKSQISIIFDLPFLYGIYLIERIRRSNFENKIRRLNTNQLAFKRDWLDNYGQILSVLKISEDSFMDSDIISISSPSSLSSNIDLINIKKYIETLKNNGILKDYTEVLTKELTSINDNDDLKISSIYTTPQYDELIQGYQSRIKKLEHMLHEQKFNNSWQNNGVNQANNNLNNSLYNNVQAKPPAAVSLAKTNTTTTSINNIITLVKSKRNESHTNNLNNDKAFRFSWIKKKDPKNELLSKLTQDKNIELVNSIILPGNYEGLTANNINDSVDKLKGGITELNDKAKTDYKTILLDQDNIKVSNAEWNKLKNKNNELVVTINEVQNFQKAESETYQKKIEDLTNLLNIRKKENTKLKQENLNLQAEVSNLKEEITTVNNNLNNLTRDKKHIEDSNSKYVKEIEDLTNFKNNIMANLQSKEREFKIERNLSSEKIGSLNLRIEHLENVEDELITINKELNSKILFFFKYFNILLHNVDENHLKFSEILKIINTNYHLFFNILKSIGLLIINNDEDFNGIIGSFLKNDTVKVLRVKGLKNANIESNLWKDYNKKYTDLMNQIGNLNLNIINQDEYFVPSIHNSNVIKLKSGDSVCARQSNASSENDFAEEIDDSQLNTLEIHINDYFAKSSDYNQELTNFISFIESINSEDLFFNAIIKRFKDIELLAKKLQKNQYSNSSKISIKNFKVNDLVLFLPTTDEDIEDKDINSKPWVAFNIGSPHYFLNKVKNYEKDYLIAKVTKIYQYKVTEENANDSEQNKYNLSIGLTWFLVDVEECDETELK